MNAKMIIPSSFHKSCNTMLVRIPADMARALGKGRGDKCVVEMVSEKELRILME